MLKATVMSSGRAGAYPGWHTPGVQTEDGVLAPPGKLKNGAPSAEVLDGGRGLDARSDYFFFRLRYRYKVIKNCFNFELTGLKCA